MHYSPPYPYMSLEEVERRRKRVPAPWHLCMWMNLVVDIHLRARFAFVGGMRGGGRGKGIQLSRRGLPVCQLSPGLKAVNVRRYHPIGMSSTTDQLYIVHVKSRPTGNMP